MAKIAPRPREISGIRLENYLHGAFCVEEDLMAMPSSVHRNASLSRLATLSVVSLVVTVALSKSAGAQYLAGAQYEVSGHAGVAFPLATFTSAAGASSPTTIAGNFKRLENSTDGHEEHYAPVWGSRRLRTAGSGKGTLLPLPDRPGRAQLPMLCGRSSDC
jgi:hypothetical protein